MNEANRHPVSRVLSVTTVLAYATISFVAGGPSLALRTVGFCVLPLACIWFPQSLGDYVGGFLNTISKASPAPVVWLMGWVLLLLPVIGLGLAWLETVR